LPLSHDCSKDTDGTEEFEEELEFISLPSVSEANCLAVSLTASLSVR